MFGGPPPQASPAEIRAQEQEASQTIKMALVAAVMLYLSPFAIDTVRKLA